MVDKDVGDPELGPTAPLESLEAKTVYLPPTRHLLSVHRQGTPNGKNPMETVQSKVLLVCINPSTAGRPLSK